MWNWLKQRVTHTPPPEPTVAEEPTTSAEQTILAYMQRLAELREQQNSELGRIRQRYYQERADVQGRYEVDTERLANLYASDAYTLYRNTLETLIQEFQMNPLDAYQALLTPREVRTSRPHTDRPPSA